MSWLLTAPISTGGLDTVSSYATAYVTRLTHTPTEDYVNVVIEYGNFSGPTWVPGLLPTSKAKQYSIQGTAYTSFVATDPLTGEKSYHAFMRAVYERLAANSVIPAGTYVGDT